MTYPLLYEKPRIVIARRATWFPTIYEWPIVYAHCRGSTRRKRVRLTRLYNRIRRGDTFGKRVLPRLSALLYRLGA